MKEEAQLIPRVHQNENDIMSLKRKKQNKKKKIKGSGMMAKGTEWHKAMQANIHNIERNRGGYNDNHQRLNPAPYIME